MRKQRGKQRGNRVLTRSTPSVRTAIATALLFFMATPLLAQKAMFRNYSVEQGLSQSQVEAVIQDQDGYIWAGTHHGLSRFDGHGFKNFTSKDGLCSPSPMGAR